MEFFQDISKAPLSKVVMLHIKNAILSGQLKFEEKIPTERELAAGFKVSRNMVREAIRALEMAGYLEVRQGPKGGAFVKEFTPDRLSGGFLDYYLAKKLTMEELTNVRLHIEPEVARLAAININPENSALLQSIIDSEYMADSIDDRVVSLTKFHLALSEICGNFFYEIIINTLVSITREIVVAGYRGGDTVVHGLEQHNEILMAVLDGDPEKASSAMLDHLTKFSNGMIEFEEKYRHRISLR
ncbi:MAG: FadR family transcriptional regulator [Deltaproteobacteria bacterium]|nr:FadR family transcriptional regulator [Deltaproteobacteria bacterium]